MLTHYGSPCHKFRRRRLSNRHGSTLVELMGATIVTALVLVPSMKLLHRSHQTVDRLHDQVQLEHLAASEIHYRLSRLALNFNATQVSGDFAAMGHGDCRFITDCSDAYSAGGVPDQLMSVETVVWRDFDDDGAIDDGEPTYTLATTLAEASSG